MSSHTHTQTYIDPHAKLCISVLSAKEWNPGIVCSMCFQSFGQFICKPPFSLVLPPTGPSEVTIGPKEVNAQITQKFHRATSERERSKGMFGYFDTVGTREDCHNKRISQYM